MPGGPGAGNRHPGAFPAPGPLWGLLPAGGGGEAQEESAPPEENALRARRLSFYERSGFRRLDYQTRIFGVQYAMLVWPEEDAAEPERLQDAHRGLYRGQLPNPLFRRVIHIPADEH